MKRGASAGACLEGAAQIRCGREAGARRCLMKLNPFHSGVDALEVERGKEL